MKLINWFISYEIIFDIINYILPQTPLHDALRPTMDL